MVLARENTVNTRVFGSSNGLNLYRIWRKTCIFRWISTTR